MAKAREDVQDYCTAHEASQILTEKHGRPVRTDYISKMVKMKKHRIRATRRHDVYLYHREDVRACSIREVQKH